MCTQRTPPRDENDVVVAQVLRTRTVIILHYYAHKLREHNTGPSTKIASHVFSVFFQTFYFPGGYGTFSRGYITRP